MVRSEIITCAFLGFLIFSLFFSASVEAASYPDLSIIGVGPWNAGVDGKYVSGYRVAVANYGSAPSQNATLEFYVRTYDGKILNRNFTVPAMPAGSARGLKFSMCNGTDGSLKNGYVIVNRKKAFVERSYKNNARNFALKESIPLSSNLTVDEYRKDYTPVSGVDSFYVSSYNSPLSSHVNITSIDCKLDGRGNYYYYPDYMRVHIPGYMHNNVTFTVDGVNYAPTSWTADTITCNIPNVRRNFDFSVNITGESLETKNTFGEPFELIDIYGSDIASRSPRIVKEQYYSPFNLVKLSSKTSPFGSSYIASSTATIIVVKGDNGGCYAAGWFIKPKGNLTKVTALYDSNSLNASAVSGYYGVCHPTIGQSSLGFQIEGSNLGFSNFKTFGFLPWTWRDQY